MASRPGLLDGFLGHLSEASREALSACIRVCDEMGLPVFLVGGSVRDLLLGSVGADLDLAMEGDAGPAATRVAESIGARLVKHERFGTATVKGPSFRLDLARTRRETYARPGALPEVEPATLMEDLARRDFSINAMALRLTSPAGELVDPFGGRRDVKRRLIRVLHEGSFQDDATRMLRAARYAARLGFALETETEVWLRRDLDFAGSISGPRLRRELELILGEQSALEAALLARDLGVLRTVHPSLQLPGDVADRWRASAGQLHTSKVELGLCVLIKPANEASLASVNRRLHLTSTQRAALRDLVKLQSMAREIAAAHDDAAFIVEMLDGRSPAAIHALAIRAGGVLMQACESYLAHWRYVRPHLRGEDLLVMGVPQGPKVGAILKEIRAARLRRTIETREDEVKMVEVELGRERR